MENKIRELILLGKTFDDIYYTLDTTKTMIVNTFKNIDKDTRYIHGWDYTRSEMERALFSLHRKYRYYRNVSLYASKGLFDYVLFEDNNPRIAILVLGYRYMSCNNIPLYGGEEYDYLIEELNEKIRICSQNNLPLMFFPFLYRFDSGYIANDIRDALKDSKTVISHNNYMKTEYMDVCNAVYNFCYDNYDHVKNATLCGCYNCGTVVKPDAIRSYSIDEGAVCPICGDESIITDSQGFPISEEFMKKVKEVVELYGDD